MRFNNPYWSNKLRISTLQRWVIVHSILYYEMDNSIVEDKVFDANARQLVQMQHDYPEDTMASDYYYVFYDFDGSTGFDLYHRLSKQDKAYLTHMAQHILSLERGELHGSQKR